MAFTGLQGDPAGKSVVNVIVTILPASSAEGVYVKMKGDDVAVAGTNDPCPLLVSVTPVALPPKTLSLTVSPSRVQVVPLS